MRRARNRLGYITLLSLAIVLSLCSCSSIAPSEYTPLDYIDLRVDPAECTRINLRTDVGISSQTIEERSALPGQAIVVLQYLEYPRRGISETDHAGDLVNIYLVSNISIDDLYNAVVNYRYLVTELWRFYPMNKVKVCLQWTIWEDHLGQPPAKATMHVLIEKLDGEIIEDHMIPIDQETLVKLSVFYDRMRQAIQDKLERSLSIPRGITSARKLERGAMQAGIITTHKRDYFVNGFGAESGPP